jgi:hypothetical protein
MRPVRATDLLAPSVLILMPVPLLAQAPAEPEAVREFQLHHMDVKDANVIVRSVLNPHKLALDEQRQVYIVTDTTEQLDRIADLLARIDVPAPEWTVSLVARAGSNAMPLRTATITQGRLEVQYGPAAPAAASATDDNFGVRAAITRAASGEVDLDWSMSLGLQGRPPESAHAVETLHDGATVTLLQVSEPYRRERLRRLLGQEGIESIVLEITRRDGATPAGEGAGR